MLSPISGNGGDRGIRKTRTVEKKKSTEFKIYEQSLDAYIDQKTRHQNEEIKASLSTELSNYLQARENYVLAAYRKEM